MSLRTRFCEVVGVEAPVCRGGMAGGHAGPRPAAGGWDAGGVGGLGGGDRGGAGGLGPPRRARGAAGGQRGGGGRMAVGRWGGGGGGEIRGGGGGGMGDGRGLVAALALGAQGVVMGTRFVATVEATPPVPGHREKIVGASADDTV